MQSFKQAYKIFYCKLDRLLTSSWHAHMDKAEVYHKLLSLLRPVRAVAGHPERAQK